MVLIDEIEAIKDLIEGTKKNSDSRVWKVEKKMLGILINFKKFENSIECLNNNVVDIYCVVEANSSRLASLEEKSYNLGLSVKAMEARMSKRFQNTEEKLGIKSNSQSDPQGSINQQNIEFEKVRSDTILNSKLRQEKGMRFPKLRPPSIN